MVCLNRISPIAYELILLTDYSVLTNNHIPHDKAGTITVFHSYTKHTLVGIGAERPYYTVSLVYPFGFPFPL